MRNFKLITSVALVAVLLQGCYRFVEPPFIQGELVPMEETELGRLVRANAAAIPDTHETAELRRSFLSNPRVYVVEQDFLILQKLSEETSKWEVAVMTRNEHHFMLCQLLEHKDVQLPDGVELRKDKKTPDALLATGTPEAVRELALRLSLSAPKICMAVPYADVAGAGAAQ